MAQWGLGMDESGPVQVESVYADFLPKGSLFNAATHTFFRCKYANDTVVECITAEPSVRCVFEGTDGVVRIDNMGQNFAVIPEKLKPKPALDTEKYHSGDDHIRNFLECIKSRQEPAAPIEVGHRSATVCHLGNIAIQLNKKLSWDPKEERFNDDERDATALLDRAPREWWKA
jgi:hypothetical protein